MQATAPVTTRIAIRNILFATDFSEVSKAALPYATDLARWYGSKIFVTHVVPYEPYLSVPLEPIPVDMDLFWNREKQWMEAFVNKASFGEVQHEEVLQRGELWHAIAGVIEKKKIDLVVAGTHGRKGLKKVMLGSAAEKIYRQATCPVLTVGPEAVECCQLGWELKQIIFATDFSEKSLHALPYALSLAEENQANLIFLHIVSLVPHEYKDSIVEETRKRLRALMPDEPWCTPEFLVGFDFPASGILQVACERQADLIVMGVGKPAAATLTSHLPWSTAADVVSAAPCPVLTVRE